MTLTSCFCSVPLAVVVAVAAAVAAVECVVVRGRAVCGWPPLLDW